MPAPAAQCFDDSELLQLEKEIFAAREKAQAYDPELYRLSEIWETELSRLEGESHAGRSTMSTQERWDAVKAMPESAEHTRLTTLQRPFWDAFDVLLDKFLAIPAKTDGGRRAKVNILLGCVWGDWFSFSDEGDEEYPFMVAKNLLIEFCGPAGEQLAADFAQVRPCES
jgi:hypothetical protein